MAENDSARRRFLLVFVWVGFWAQIVQVVLMRELAIVFGGSEFVVGVTFAIWFLCVGLGSAIGGLYADKLVNPGRLWSGPLPLLLVLVLPVALYLIRMSRQFFPASTGADIPYYALLFVPLLTLGPICFLIGFAFVMGAHYFRDTSLLYVVEAVGSLLAGLAFHFVCMQMPALPLLLWIGMLLSVSFLFCFWPWSFCKTWHEGKAQRPWLLLAGTMLMMLLTGVCPSLETWMRRQQWQTIAPGQTFLREETSRHGYLAVLDLAGQKNFYWDGRYCMSISPNERSSLANLAHLFLVQHPSPQKILVIGNGLHGFLHEALQYPQLQIHYSELAPELVWLAQRYLPAMDRRALADPRVRVSYEDGRRFLQTCVAQYDIIISLVADPATAALNRYYTLEYFRLVKAALRPGGVFIFSLESLPFPEGEILQRNALILHTLAEVFREVRVTAGTTSFFMACDQVGHITFFPEECQERFRALARVDTDFEPQLYSLLLEPQIQKQSEQRLMVAAGLLPAISSVAENLELPSELLGEPVPLSSPTALHTPHVCNGALPVNSDFHPRAILSTLRLSGMFSFTEGAFSTFTRYLEIFTIILGGAIYVVLLLSCLRPLFPQNWQHALALGGPVPVLLLTTALGGFFGIAAEIILLWAFLSSYGYLYTMVGIFAATFMLGLTAGAYLARLSLSRFSPTQMLVVVMAAIGLYLLLLPFVYGMHSAVLFLLMNLIAGLLVGFLFPVANHFYQNFAPLARSAGLLYGADMAGACLGALLIGFFAIPLWGTWVVCLAIAGACWLSALAVSAVHFSEKKQGH